LQFKLSPIKLSLIRVANVQNINQSDIISPYFSLESQKIIKINDVVSNLIEKELIYY